MLEKLRYAGDPITKEQLIASFAISEGQEKLRQIFKVKNRYRDIIVPYFFRLRIYIHSKNISVSFRFGFFSVLLWLSIFSLVKLT